MADPFSEYRRKSPHGRGCRVCGAPNVGRVQITLQGKNESGGWPSVNSESASYCAEHAIEVYEAAKAAVDQVASRREHGNA